MKRIAVDMDEVIADALSEHLRRYNSDHGTQITKADLEGKWLADVVSSDQKDEVYSYLHSPDFFADLPVIEGSREVLLELSGRYEIFIASAAMIFPNSFLAKFQWLQRYFPFIEPDNIAFIGDKSILRADFLIDDIPWNLERFQGQGILFSAPHNCRIPDASLEGIVRVESWRDIREYFRG